ncbi:pre-mRNA-processing factor, putative [Entamoeba histolytica HM-3:IMSS]|uniref:Pre-mRNA-processing factor, putative n=2 Tax=Entamoeba histolytica TaxID=5759 RepID=M7WXD0_ENTHI|nr:pre-mRNA-processing factor, putative [Entamoeba histolytica HM-3:IMSS]
MKPQGKYDFLNMEGPKGYIAGSLREDTGFITQNDIGPARTLMVGEGNFDDEPEEENGVNDEIAEKTYEIVEKRMEERRKKRKEIREKKEQEEYEKKHPTISQQFADIKDEIKKMSLEDWMKIPEATGRRNQKVQNEFLEGRHMPLPDTVIVSNYNLNQIKGTIIPTQTDLIQLGNTRKKTLQLSLDGSKTSISSVDVNGYLTELGQNQELTENDVTQIKQYKFLFKSMRTTKPQLAVGWIQSALIEESLGHLSAARKLIMEGTQKCPNSDEIWLQAIRLHPIEVRSDICASAIAVLPKKPSLWLEAIELEKNIIEKRKIAHKGLEFVSNSIELWKKTIELEDGEIQKQTMKQAVETLPQCVELWIIFAEKESYENSKKILNQSLKILPKEPLIWIAAARIEEIKGHNPEKAIGIIKKALKYFDKENLSIEKNIWIDEGVKYINEAKATLKGIIEYIIDYKEKDLISFWKHIEQTYSNDEITKMIYQHAVQVQPQNDELWMELIRVCGNDEKEIEVVFQHAIDVIDSKEIWKKFVEWCMKRTPSIAQSLLQKIINKGKGGESVWLGIIDLELNQNHLLEAFNYVQQGIKICKSIRLIKKGIKIALSLKDEEKENEMILSGDSIDPQNVGLILFKIKREIRKQNFINARKIYENALKLNETSVKLWDAAAQCELHQPGSFSVSKARTIYERGKNKNPTSQDLWISLIHFERENGNKKVSDSYLSEGIKVCKSNGKLWKEIIQTSPINKKKTTCSDALRAFEGRDKDVDYANVVFAVAEFLYNSGKKEKAEEWFRKVIFIDPNYGDAWIWIYKIIYEKKGKITDFEMKKKDCIEKCSLCEHKKGLIWSQVKRRNECCQYSIEEILEKGRLAIN